ncbi:uncharacterized protein LOC143293672 isoform X2 [Babylonia areolata]
MIRSGALILVAVAVFSVSVNALPNCGTGCTDEDGECLSIGETRTRQCITRQCHAANVLQVTDIKCEDPVTKACHDAGTTYQALPNLSCTCNTGGSLTCEFTG